MAKLRRKRRSLASERTIHTPCTASITNHIWLEKSIKGGRRIIRGSYLLLLTINSGVSLASSNGWLRVRRVRKKLRSREKSKQQSFFDFFWWTSTHEKKRCQTRYIISVIQSREIVNCFEKIMISPKGKWKAIAAKQRRKRHAKNIKKNLFTLARKKSSLYPICVLY